MNIRSLIIVCIFFIVSSMASTTSGEEELSDSSDWIYDGRDTIHTFTSDVPGDVFYDFVNTYDLFEFRAQYINSLSSADIDGDGCSDFILCLNFTDIICVSGRDGSIILQKKWSEEIWSSPLIFDLESDGSLDIVLGFRSGIVICYQLDNGWEQSWTFNAGNQLSDYSQMMAIPAEYSTHNILFTDVKGTIHCLSYNGSIVWQLEFEKKWPRSLSIYQQAGIYKILSSTIEEPASEVHIEADIVKVDYSSGTEEKSFVLDFASYYDYFYTRPTVMAYDGEMSIIIGGNSCYILDYYSLELKNEISGTGALKTIIPIILKDRPHILFRGGSSVSLYNMSDGSFQWTLLNTASNSIGHPIVLCDLDQDDSLEVIIPVTHHIKIMDLDSGDEEHRINFDDKYTRGKMIKPIISDVDGDGFSELVYLCRLDTMRLQVFETPNIDFTMNSSLMKGGTILYPEISQRIGFRITNVPSLDRISRGILTIGDGDTFPQLELLGSSCTIVMNDSRHIVSGLKIITSDHVIEYQFDLTIDWEIATEELQASLLSIGLDHRPLRNLSISNVIRCENDLVFDRQLLVLDPNGDPVDDGSWVHPTAMLEITGGRVVFKGSEITPVDQPFNVTMHTPNDSIIMVVRGDGTFGTTVDLSNFTNDLWTISVRIEDVTYNGSGLTPLSFECRIDRLPPEISLTNPDPGAWRTRERLTVGFELFDNESGLDTDTVQILVTFNDTTVHLVEAFELSILSPGHIRIVFVVDLQEGRNWFELEVGDKVGNMNVSLPIPVNIDTSQIIFEDITPTEWHNLTRVTVGIAIIDNGGSGVDLSTIEYSYSISGLFSYSEWLDLGYDGTASAYTVSLVLDLEEGVENYVRFRARDVAGTEPRISDDYQVHIDTTTPQINIIDEVHNHLNTTIRFALYDDPSGIDLESMAIVVSSNGTEIDDITIHVSDRDPGEYFVSVDCTFLVYNLNEIRIDVFDHAVNGNTTTFVISINAPPALQIISPINESKHNVNTLIQFEAQIFDPDGDLLEVVWSLSNGTILNTSALFDVQLEPGTYYITCRLTDGHEHVVIETITLVVKDEPPPDRFSFIINDPNLLLLIIILVVVILVLAYYYRYRLVREEA